MCAAQADAPRASTLPVTDHSSTDASTFREGGGKRVAFGAGETAGRFRILGEIARGGMGVVYRAYDPDLKREVAIKTLGDRLVGSDSAASRFLDEARITGRLQHPSVPPVHEVGHLADGRPFLTMKLIRGHTLAELLGAAAFRRDASRLVQIFEQICQTVGFAHAQGVIHRDLKPSNVMVGSFGEVQVMDWGLARSLDDDAEPQPADAAANPSVEAVTDSTRMDTRTGSVLGTLAYMPPEQAQGHNHLMGRRADVFALGAILCQMLTSKPPYVGDADAIWRQATFGFIGDAFGRLDQSGAAPELIELAKRCLSTKIDDRPADGSAVADAVAAFRAGVGERLRNAERAKAAADAKAIELRKRRRVQIALAASIVTLAAGTAMVAWWQDRQASNRRTEVASRAFEERLSEQRRKDAERERVGRNEQAMAGLLGQCEAALKTDDRDRAETAFADAERRLPDGGDDGLAERFARCRADVALLKELDRIDDLRWTWTDGQFRIKEAEAAWAALFKSIGIVPGETLGEGAAARMNGSLVSRRLLAALEVWRDRTQTPELLALMKAVDGDAYRNEFREAVHLRRLDRMRELAAKPEALEQPAWFACAMGRGMVVEIDRVRLIMLHAFRREPRDLALLMTMGRSYNQEYRGGSPQQRASWYRVAVAVKPRNAAAWTNLSEAELRQDRPEAAELTAREAIRLDPTLANAHTNLAQALKDRGAPGAEASFREALRLNPAHAGAHNGMGQIAIARGDNAAATRHFNDALRHAPSMGAALSNLGLQKMREGKVDEAIALYERAIAADPKLGPAYSNLGRALRAKKDYRGMIERMTEAIRNDPSNANAHEIMGLAFQGLKQPREAEAAYRTAFRIDPKFASPHYNLGNLLRDRDNADGAIAEFKEALRLDPGLAMAHVNLGNMLAKHRNDLEAAIAHYRKAIAADKGLAAAHFNLGRALQQLRRRDEAMDCYRTVVAIEPTNAWGHYLLAMLLRETNQPDASLAAAREAVRHDPKFREAHVHIGNLLGEKQKFDESMAAFQAAVAADPGYAPAHYASGLAHNRRNEFAAAIAAYRETIRLDPKFAFAHNNLGMLLRQKGDLDAAIECFRAALKIDPKLRPAINNLEAALKAKAK